MSKDPWEKACIAFFITMLLFAGFGLVSHYLGDIIFAHGPLPGFGLLCIVYVILTLIGGVVTWLLTRNIVSGGRRSSG